MKKELDGVIWDLNELSFETPFPSDRGKSCSFFLQSLATFTWNTLRSFEDNPATLTQTTSILAGHSVSGLSKLDLLQIKISVTVQEHWQASSRKTNLSYPLRQPVIYTTTSEKKTPWNGVSFGRELSAYITFHLSLRPKISRTLFKTASTFCNMKSPILWNAPSAFFFS